MNMIYTNNDYCVRRFSNTRRRSLFWNRVADGILCAASTMGIGDTAMLSRLMAKVLRSTRKISLLSLM